MKNSYSDEELIQAVKESLSLADVMRKLNLKVAGANYRTIHKNIERLKLSTDHFTGQGWNTGDRYRPVHPPQELSEILIENSTYTNTNHLRERLLKERMKEYKCECCGKTEWMGQNIPLELHHINGNHSDLRIENLQLLCPNCHAFTDNYRGKGMSAQRETSEVETAELGEGLELTAQNNAELNCSNT